MKILNEAILVEQGLRKALDEQCAEYREITKEKEDLETKRRNLDMNIRKASTYLREFRKANNLNYCNEEKCVAKVSYLNIKCTNHMRKAGK